MGGYASGFEVFAGFCRTFEPSSLDVREVEDGSQP